jgi:site-specific DNA-methyltransferase (adenine-specific)
MAGHWLTTSQWALPTAANYAWLQALCNGHLRREYEDLRREYEDLRRFFDMRTGDQKTDVWRFNPETERLGHPTVKPLPLVSYIVRLSCRSGGTVLDPFAGSCTTARAAKDLGRKCVCIEREERYCEIGAKRMAQEVLNLGG